MMVLGTSRGVIGIDDAGEEVFRVLEGFEISHVHLTRGGRLLAVADRTVILAAPSLADAGDDHAWERLGELPDTVAHCFAELDGRLFIGAADARVFGMPADGGEPHRLDSFDAIPTRESWDTPWGGPPDVRSLAVIDGPEPAIYADIHVGGIVRSFDLGASWSQAPGSLHRDVHRVSTHPDRPDMVLAATAQGCFISRDRGESWEGHLEPFGPRSYQRCIVADTGDPDLMLCTASRGPHPHGESGCEAMVFRSEDGGATWAATHSGLPEHFHYNINTHMLAASPERPGVFAFHDDLQSVYLTDDGARSWRPVASCLTDVTAAIVV